MSDDKLTDDQIKAVVYFFFHDLDLLLDLLDVPALDVVRNYEEEIAANWDVISEEIGWNDEEEEDEEDGD